MAFDPRYPDTSNSLNRVVIADLPGLNLPDEVKGKSGYDLVSTAALDKLIEAHRDDFAFISRKSPEETRGVFFVRLSHGDTTAIHVAETMGRNLGYLLLTLIRGDEVNRKARPEWDDSHWELWDSILTVHLGGGFPAYMGGLMLRGIRKAVSDSGAQGSFKKKPYVEYIHKAGTDSGSKLAVDIAPYPHILPLMGAARYIPTGSCGCVLDFGGTWIKRGIAYFESSGLAKIQLLPMVTVELSPNMWARTIRTKMVDVIVDTVKKQNCDANVIPISIAAYVDANGQPLIAQGGIYMQLAQLSDDVPAMLSAEVSKSIGRQVQIKLLHDGTAAASFYAPEENAAVIMIGTALGSGYCVARPELRVLSPHLSITGEHGG